MKRIFPIIASLLVIVAFAMTSCAPEIPEVPTPETTIPEITTPTLPDDAEIEEEPSPEPTSSLSELISIPEIATPGNKVTLDATKISERFGTEITFSWEQVRLPDKYDGSEYVSGNEVALESTSHAVTSFTPEWPGNYRFLLSITGPSVDEEIPVDVSVKPSQSPFKLRGFALDMWHYTDSLAYMAPDFFERANDSGAQIVMLSPTWYASSKTANSMSPCPLGEFDPNICRGVMSDEKLITMIQQAHASGLEVMIKPILNIVGPSGPEWPDIQATDWDEWFRNWTNVLLHYGEIAEQEKVEYLALGNELRTTTEHTERWRMLIREVRQVYSGKLTYGDNSFSYGDWGKFQVWDELDYIGVHYWGPASGAYGVPESTHPTVEEMVTVIDKQLSEFLDPVVGEFQKPVLILEFGTASYNGTNIGHFQYNDTLDNSEQSEYYEAGLRVFASRDYVEGVLIWAYTWESYHNTESLSMNPMGKPAEEVLKIWFGATD